MGWIGSLARTLRRRRTPPPGPVARTGAGIDYLLAQAGRLPAAEVEPPVPVAAKEWSIPVWVGTGVHLETEGRWAEAVAHWTAFDRRFPGQENVAWRLHDALLRLADADPDRAAATAKALDRDPQDSPGDVTAMMQSFESLGGFGPGGGCEFGMMQRLCGSEALGLLRWATVEPQVLIKCLAERFEAVGDPATTELFQSHDDPDNWQIRDTRYRFEMHSFVPIRTMTRERMLTAACKRMRYLGQKLVADLTQPSKIFVLKSGMRRVSPAEVDALSQGIRAFGPANILCVCPPDQTHAEGTIELAAPAVYIGYMDFVRDKDSGTQLAEWIALCTRMLGLAGFAVTDFARLPDDVQARVAAAVVPPLPPPRDWQPIDQAAHQALARGDLAEADRLWAEMRLEFPFIFGGFTGGAAVFRARGQTEEARLMLTEGAARFPYEVSFPIDLGRLAMQLADWPAAEAHWRKTLDMNFRDWWIYTELAAALENQGRLDESDAVLIAAQTQSDHPEEITLYLAPAMLAARREQWAAAVGRWTEALRRFPGRADILAGLREALTRLDIGDPQAAETARSTVRQTGLAPDLESVSAVREALSIWVAVGVRLEEDGKLASAVAHWTEMDRRFPGKENGARRLHDALLRLADADPDRAAVAASVLDRAVTESPEDVTAMMHAFESLGGFGPLGGCEFGMMQRLCGSEALGLLRWASVTPQILINCLEGRFEGIGERATTELWQSFDDPDNWQIRDTRYGFTMHSFVSIKSTPHDRMLAAACKRMGYLARKLVADLANPSKIFVLKSALRRISPAEAEALSRGIRSFGPGSLLCVCPADDLHPAGTIEDAAPGVYLGSMDFVGQPPSGTRLPDWIGLCTAMLARVGFKVARFTGLPDDVFVRVAAASLPPTHSAPDWQPLHAAAEQAYARGDLDRASRLYKELRSEFGAVFGGFTGGAAVLRAQSRPDEARLMLEEAAIRFPYEVTVPIDLGKLATDQADWVTAERHWRQALDMNPRVLEVYTLLATALENLGRPGEADATLREALRHADHSGERTLYIALAQRATQREDWAVAGPRWVESWRRFPTDAETLSGLNEVLKRLTLRDPALAQAVLRDLREVGIPPGLAESPDPGTLMAVAEFAVRTGLTEWVTRLRDIVLTRFPEIPEAFVVREEALRSLRRFDEAEATLADAITRWPGNWRITRQIGLLAEARGDWARAVAHWTEMGRRFPVHEAETWRLHQAMLRLAESDPNAAEAAARALRKADPGHLTRLALSFESLGGAGPAGGCEFGGVQRFCGAEPLGLLRWASVMPHNLIDLLEGRFEGVGDTETTELYFNDDDPERLWQIRDLRYGFDMHSFVAESEVPFDRMMIAATRRMRYLRDKLLEDLRNPSKIFVLKAAERGVTPAEVDAIAAGIRSFGPGTILCVVRADPDHPAGTLSHAAPGVIFGYLDFSTGTDHAPRLDAWIALCRKLLINHRTYPAIVQ